MANILITGGTGFLGSNLTRYLLSQGNKVVCLDNNYTGRMSNIEDLLANPNFSFVKHDICQSLLDCKELQEKLPQVEQIFNLACPASPPAYQGEHALDTTKTCTIGMLNVLDYAQQHQATVLQTSTSEVYGDPLVHPQKEDYRGNVNPIGVRACYDEGKRCAESICFDYHRIYGTKIKVIRIFNTYGPYMDPHDGRVISNFICQALRGEDITIYGSGNQTRSFCYVDDLVKGMVLMMNSRADFTGPVNLGTPYEFTISQLADLVIQKIQGPSKIVYCDLPQDDPQLRKPNIELAQQQLSWCPEVMLSAGLDKTIAYFKSQL